MQNVQEFNSGVLQKNIISQRSPITGNTLFYVLVHKESQSGFLYNERMLVIEDKSYSLFYTKHIKPIDKLLKLEKQGLKPIKQSLLLINTTAEVQSNIVKVRFIAQKITKHWLFRFANDNLALKWFVLYKDLHEKSIAKSFNSKSKDTASEQRSMGSIVEYASILSKNKYYNQSPALKAEISHQSKVTERLKQIEESLIEHLE